MKTPRNLLRPAILLLAIAGSAPADTIPLFTDGFETYPLGPASTGLPTQFSPPPRVSGDPALIVNSASTENIDGIAPRSGSQMLLFVNTYHLDPMTTGSNGDLYYLFDLESYGPSLALGGGSADLSAWFNTGSSADDNAFFVGLGAYGAAANLPEEIRLKDGVAPNRLGSHVNNEDNPLLTDTALTNPTTFATTWQEDSVSLALPTNTRFLVARFAAKENNSSTDPDFMSAFVDDIQINLNLPNGFIDPNPGGQPVPASGSTLVFLGTALSGLLLLGKRRGKKA